MDYVPVDINQIKLDPVPSGFVPVDINSIKLDAPEQSILSKANRLAGIGARGVVTGIASIPDIPENVYNLIEYAGTKLASKEPHYLPTPFTSGATKLLDAMNFPKAETGGERILQVAGSGVGGGSAFSGIGAVSGGTGAASSQLAAEAGGGTFTQLVSGIIGGMTPVNAMNAMTNLAKSGYSTIKNISNPANRENIGKILVESAGGPEEAKLVAARLSNAPEYVPGSTPTSGELSGNNQFIAAQAAFERRNPASAISDVRQANAAARNNYLSDIARTPEELERAKISRSEVTGPMYEQAREDLLNAKAIQPVLQHIDSEIEAVGAHTDTGKKLLEIKNKINQSLPTIQENKSPILDLEGNPISTPVFKNAKQGPLVQVYKEERDAAAKTAMQEGALASSVKGVVKPIIRELGDALEKQSKKLSEANAKFRSMSEPINQMEELQRIQEKTRLTGQDIGGQSKMSLAKLNTALSNEGRAELSKVLTPEQMGVLDNLQKDLNRESVIGSVRPSGSNTAADIVAGRRVDEAIGQLLAGNFISRIPWAGRAINAGMTSRMMDKIPQGLGKAYANPQEAQAAIKAALKSLQKEQIPAQMKRVALQSILGSSIGSLPVSMANEIMKGNK